ncbi:MAG: HAD family hydrolase [Clostridia bacterium]|nr:HAD family hydrolase [Clostridia bacterium]
MKDKRYDGVLLCTDVDGTLADDSGKANIPQENIDAINYFMSKGGLFTLATGRQKKFLTQFDGLFKVNAPIVAINGTVVIENNKILYSHPLPENAIKDIEDIIKKYPLFYESNLRTFDDHRIYTRENGKIVMTKDAVGTYYKCIFLFDTEKECVSFKEIMEKEYGNKYQFDRSWPFELELHDKNSGKGDAIRFLRKYYGEKIKKIVCVGDYENDISMMSEADLSIAVANGVDTLKKVCDIQTVSCYDNAIAKIIYDIL